MFAGHRSRLTPGGRASSGGCEQPDARPRSWRDAQGGAKGLTIARILLATAFLSAGSAFAQDSDDACPISVPSGEVAGDTFLCGRIEMPENWDAPDGRRIDVSYVVLRSTSLAPFADPVIYFQGGPGGSALNSLAPIQSGTAALRANRDVILFEQRGTAHSNDLFCPPEIRTPRPDTYEDDLEAADARVEALNIDAYSDPGAVYEAIAAYGEIRGYRRCVPYLESLGNDLSQYGTDSTVQDVVRLMEHLDYPAYNLFGGSYGSTVVLAILDHLANDPAGDLPVLRSAVVDGVAPRNKDFYEMAFVTPYVILRVFTECEREPACESAYPNIRDRAIRLLERLQAAPLPRDDAEDITLEQLREVLQSAVTNQQKLVPFLPRLIDELERGETAVFDLAQAAIAHEVTLPDVHPKPEPPAPEGLAAVEAQLDEITARFDAIEESLALVFLSDGIIREAILEASSRQELFLRMIDGLIEAGGGTVGNMLTTQLEPYARHPEQRTRDGLIAFVRAAVFVPTLQAEMVSLAEGFTDEEIRLIFWRLTNYTFERGLAAVDTITHRIVRCNDEARGFFNDVAFAAYPEFEAPQLIDDSASWVANYQVSCEELGLAADAYEPPLPPVESDVPTLVVNGALDTATPAEWGVRAAEALANSTVVTIPMAGHVAGLMTECGKALVQAFILSPEDPLNRSCIDAARPVFVMPGAPLPG